MKYPRFTAPGQHCIFRQLLFLVLLLTGLKASSQNADIDLLEKINPVNPDAAFWKITSATTYPLALAAPASIWLHGELNHNRKTKFYAYELLGSVVIAGIGTQAIKTIVQRPRPYEKYNTVYPYTIETNSSFPSMHTSVAFATATSLSIQYKKWYVVAPAYVWAAGVAYSRLYLGEHYPSDVLAGATLGAGSAVVSHWISKKVFR